MAITTLAQYLAAARQQVTHRKNYPGEVSPVLSSGFANAGDPAAGTLSAGNTANGIVPVAGGSGYASINAFGSGNTGYITRADYAPDSPTKTLRMELFDRLFAAGAYSFGANTALASQPSYSGRVPGAPDYKGLEIWIETVTNFTGVPTFTVKYTNESGTTGQSTGAIAAPLAMNLGGCMQLPLATGDNGVQKIENVQETTSTVGTFNVMVLRPLLMLGNKGVQFTTPAPVADLAMTGMAQVFATSALYALAANITSTDLTELYIEIVNG